MFVYFSTPGEHSICIDVQLSMENTQSFPSYAEYRARNSARNSTRNSAHKCDHNCDHSSDKEVFDIICKDALKSSTGDFLSKYIYSADIERKTCILPSGKTSSWIGKSSRIMWVGVHGADSICVVTRVSDEDRIAVQGTVCLGVANSCLTLLRQAAICEIGDLADPEAHSALRGKGIAIEKPFGVVSVIPRTDETREGREHKVSDDVYLKHLEILEVEFEMIERSTDQDAFTSRAYKQSIRDLHSVITEDILQLKSRVWHHEKKAIKFLQNKLGRKMPFTVNETIQTAISALQLLFNQEYKADQIEVSVIDPDYGATLDELAYKDAYVKELDKSEIEEHLAVINEPGTINKVSAPDKCESCGRKFPKKMKAGNVPPGARASTSGVKGESEC